MTEKNIITEDDDRVVEGRTPDERVEIELTETEAQQYAEPQAAAESDDDEDEPVAQQSAGDDERETIRERRRNEKKERKERRERAIERDRVELEFLRKRNDDLERRLSGIEERTQKSDLSLLDQKLKEAVNEVQLAEKVIAKAVVAQNGEDVAQALRYRDQAMLKARQLEAAKKQAAQPRPAPTPPVDDVALSYAKEFIKEHSWYNPEAKDESSAIVLAIDNSLVKEGFNPRTEDYWDELRDRVRRRLPEKFEETAVPAAARKTERQARGGPAVGSGREHAPTSTRREVYISPERKNALIEAGLWDDPVLRQKYIKKYMEYDRTRS
jgi:hypothetical protein